MLAQQFIDRYMLTLSIKEADEQVGLITPEHVLYTVKLKSPLLKGKVKLPYQFNPKYTKFDAVEFVANTARDMTCSPLSGYTLEDMVAEIGDNGTLQTIKLWESIILYANSLFAYFGEGGIADLLNVTED
jgi:hypothetical protein